MRRILHEIRLWGAASLLLLLPLFARADEVSGNPNIPTGAQAQGFGFFSVLFGCPSGNITVVCILTNVLAFIMSIAFIITVIYLVVGGFRYVTAQGNEDAVEKAKSTITHAIIGIVVIALAWAIMILILRIANTGNPGA